MTGRRTNVIFTMPMTVSIQIAVCVLINKWFLLHLIDSSAGVRHQNYSKTKFPELCLFNELQLLDFDNKYFKNVNNEKSNNAQNSHNNVETMTHDASDTGDYRLKHTTFFRCHISYNLSKMQFFLSFV